MGQQDKVLLEETRPWPRLREALGQGEFPDPGEDETGWRDSSTQLEGALPTRQNPNYILQESVWVCTCVSVCS